jgi:type VI secretion system secreted protein VgrG
MAKRRLGMEADFFFEAGPYASKDLKVLRFEGKECFSEPFHFHLEVLMEEVEPDFEAILGKSAMLTIEGDEGTRYICGIVSKFEQSSEPTRLTQYKAELVPKIWLLGLRQKSRIFQEMSVPNIIKKVLTDAGIPSGEFQLKLKANYQDREYCVQYRESDLAFISRLMEEEGIYYWFQHSENKHVLIMGDASSAHTKIDGDSKLFFQSATGQEPDIEHIFKFQYAQAVRPGEVVLRDFDFKKPKLDLTAKKAADRDTSLEIYDCPGEYTLPSVGATLSEIRLQELQTSRKVGNGKSNCRRLLPGFKFTLADHARPDLNREYLLTRVLHFGTQLQALKEAAGTATANEYRAEFGCIPSNIQFRPARVTPRPLLAGSQTAIVTGPKGEEIYPDEHGRIKVQFHWDREGKRDEKSSCWIRVSQTWAGPSWGAISIPRIGQEVIVQFLEGNPDLPIITGTVYNGDNRPPFGLPGGKSQAGFKSNSTLGGGGYNEFIMDDTKGKELIRVHGQFDKDTTIEHDLREHVLNDRSRDVTNNEAIKIGVDQTYSIGSNQSGTVGKDKTIKVGSNHTESIGASKSMTVGANHRESIGSNMTITVGSNLTETVAINYAETVGAAMELTIGAAMTHTVGAALVQSVGASKSVNIGVNYTKNVGSNSSESVGGNRSSSVGKDDSLSVAKKLSVDAGDQIILKTGKASITMKKDGTITIEGKDITIKGSGEINAKASKDIVMKGKKILQN